MHPVRSLMLSTARVPAGFGAALVLVLSVQALQAQERRLGEIDFPNSGAAEAFEEAQAADPDFALAYWGEAMTYNHPLWRQQDREAMYLDAVETLYGEGLGACYPGIPAGDPWPAGPSV